MTKSEYINRLKFIAVTEPDYERRTRMYNVIVQIDKMTDVQFHVFYSTMDKIVTHSVSTTLH